MYLSEVLRCRKVVEEFNEEALAAVCREIQWNTDKLEFGPLYKTTPISARLKFTTVLKDDILNVTVDIFKTDTDVGEIAKIKVEEYGEIPINSKITIPIKFRILNT
ncbi:MAG: hypothetical protein J6A04_04515 [Clostridia bacterium]|nr:hypothetical protein [Clostridia bacterium]